MKISGLQVDRFGILNGFQAENLADGITVFYGANEAGKTTLLQFIRTMFYGFGSDRNKRYLEMQHTSGILASGSRIGGSLYLSARDDDYHVRRYSSLTDPHNTHGELRVTSRDGTRQGAHRLNTLLSGIDETILNNVFAVGLREMQYLGTLNDTQAARYLYNLSTGTDRVSLVDVMRQLNATRARLLGTPNDPGYLTELAEHGEREAVRISQLARSTDRWAHMRSELSKLEDEIRRLETSRVQLQANLRLAELALRVRPDWEQRHELNARLEALGAPREVPDSKRSRLDELNREIEAQHARVHEVNEKRAQLQAQIEELQSTRDSVRTRVRLDALLDQRTAIASLDDKVHRLRSEIEEVDFEIEAERERLQLGERAGDADHFDPARLLALREPAREMERARDQLEASKREATRHKETLERAQRELSEALGKNQNWFDESDRRDVTAAIDQTNETAAALRQRLRQQETLNRRENEFQAVIARRKRLLKNQLLPWEVIRALSVVFTLGALLLLCALFGEWLGISQTARLGFTVMGLVLTGFVGMLKMTLDGSTRDELSQVDSRLARIESEVRTAEAALERIDREVPGLKGQSLTLEDVEERLVRLESLIPLDNQRRQAEEFARRHEQRAIRLAKHLNSARERWTNSLKHVGLPTKLTPRQVWQLVGEAGNLANLNQRDQQLKAQLEQAESELSVFAKRISDTATECRLSPTGARPSELLSQLTNHTSSQKQQAAKIGQLVQRDRELKMQSRDMSRALQRLQRQRHTLLTRLGVIDEVELERELQRGAEHARLVEQRNNLVARMSELCGSEIDEQTISQQIFAATGETLETRIRTMQQQLDQQESQLKAMLVRQGQASEQVRAMTNDRELPLAHLNHAMIENRLAQGMEQLKVVSAMAGMLKHVYRRYEKERQPETLQTASGHFRHMTAERYTRIWTPLDEDVLMVEDENGKSISVDQLSRGTREQVFLALRLALVAGYSGRGARMPLVLDDVLVNFDQDRTKAAAEVLVDFAQTGGQVLLFTCHQHVAHIFSSMGIDVRQLPVRAETLADVTQPPREAEVRVERARVAKRTRSRRRPRRTTRPMIGYQDYGAVMAAEPDASASVAWGSPRRDDLAEPPVASGAGIAGLYDLGFDDGDPLVAPGRSDSAPSPDATNDLGAMWLKAERWQGHAERPTPASQLSTEESPAAKLDDSPESETQATAAAAGHEDDAPAPAEFPMVNRSILGPSSLQSIDDSAIIDAAEQERTFHAEVTSTDVPLDKDSPTLDPIDEPMPPVPSVNTVREPGIDGDLTPVSTDEAEQSLGNPSDFDVNDVDVGDDADVVQDADAYVDVELQAEKDDDVDGEARLDPEEEETLAAELDGEDQGGGDEDEYEYEYIEVDDEDEDEGGDEEGDDEKGEGLGSDDEYEYEYIEVDCEADESEPAEDEEYEYEYIEEEEDEAA